MRISTEVPTPTSEVDIGICHTNLCKVVAAANDSAFLPGNKVNPKLIVQYAKYHYNLYRPTARINMGKSQRDKYLRLLLEMA